LYGGGGGGVGGNNDPAFGTGAQGIIVIIYTPVAPVERPSMVEIWGGFFRQRGGQLEIR
jgi:hypothetical protein